MLGAKTIILDFIPQMNREHVSNVSIGIERRTLWRRSRGLVEENTSLWCNSKNIKRNSYTRKIRHSSRNENGGLVHRNSANDLCTVLVIFNYQVIQISTFCIRCLYTEFLNVTMYSLAPCRLHFIVLRREGYVNCIYYSSSRLANTLFSFTAEVTSEKNYAKTSKYEPFSILG